MVQPSIVRLRKRYPGSLGCTRVPISMGHGHPATDIDQSIRVVNLVTIIIVVARCTPHANYSMPSGDLISQKHTGPTTKPNCH